MKLLDVRHGDILLSKGTGRRYKVCQIKRYDDRPDTFRLASLEWRTTGRRWTMAEIKLAEMTKEDF